MPVSKEPEVSMSSTKKDLLDAYNQLRLQLQAKEKNELNPEKKLSRKKWLK
jgi:hypothetical protein